MSEQPYSNKTHCPNCWEVIEKNATFCPHCGISLAMPSVPPAPIRQGVDLLYEDQSIIAPPAGKGNPTPPALWKALLFCVVAFVGGGYLGNMLFAYVFERFNIFPTNLFPPTSYSQMSIFVMAPLLGLALGLLARKNIFLWVLSGLIAAILTLGLSLLLNSSFPLPAWLKMTIGFVARFGILLPLAFFIASKHPLQIIFFLAASILGMFVAERLTLFGVDLLNNYDDISFTALFGTIFFIQLFILGLLYGLAAWGFSKIHKALIKSPGVV